MVCLNPRCLAPRQSGLRLVVRWLRSHDCTTGARMRRHLGVWMHRVGVPRGSRRGHFASVGTHEAIAGGTIDVLAPPSFSLHVSGSQTMVPQGQCCARGDGDGWGPR
jgi:hypothetical protein